MVAGREGALPTPAERVALLMKVQGDSYRTAGELCGLDHTTIRAAATGETENPATLQRIAEAYGVPDEWIRGRPDVRVDFELHVLARPDEERVRLLWHKGERVAFALQFLASYDSGRFAPERLAEQLGVETADFEGLLTGGTGSVDLVAKRLEAVAGIPGAWLECGVLDADDAEDFLSELVGQAIRELGAAVGVQCDDRLITRMVACLD